MRIVLLARSLDNISAELKTACMSQKVQTMPMAFQVQMLFNVQNKLSLDFGVL